MIRAAIILLLWWICTAAQAQVLEVEQDGATHWLGNLGGNHTAVHDASATDTPAPATVPQRYREAVTSAAARYDISPWLIDAVARSESGYAADAVSPAGAIGIMQLMPDTARILSVDPRDPEQNILGGAAYLRQMLDRFDGRLDLALAAYNAGSVRVEQYGGVPPYRETQGYVRRNFERLATAAMARRASASPSTSPATGDLP